MSKLTFANFVHFHMISHYHFIVQGWMQQRALIPLRNILIERWDLWTPSGFYHLQKKNTRFFFFVKTFHHSPSKLDSCRLELNHEKLPQWWLQILCTPSFWNSKSTPSPCIYDLYLSWRKGSLLLKKMMNF